MQAHPISMFALKTESKAACQNVVSLGKVRPEKLLFYMLWSKGGRTQPELSIPPSESESKSPLALQEKESSILFFLLTCNTQAHDALEPKPNC